MDIKQNMLVTYPNGWDKDGNENPRGIACVLSTNPHRNTVLLRFEDGREEIHTAAPLKEYKG